MVATRTPGRMRRDEDGFTLPEMMVVLALMGMLLGIMFLVFNTTSMWASRVEARSIAAREARFTVDRMSRDLRQAMEIDEGSGVFAEAGIRRCVFYVDLNHDGTPEKVTYYVEGRRVRRTVAEATIPVFPYNFGADGSPSTLIGTLTDAWASTTQPIFRYQDTSGAYTASKPAISAVEIHIENQGVSGAEVAPFETRTLVKVRSVHNSITLRPVEGNCHG